ncbi:MAG TPA: helix-turn-helix transcriptional regulator, partial [Actinomycetota bacterium]|nr:helix-turn-helix transcriptional regulator [Actinomycetota bacterium]
MVIRLDGDDLDLGATAAYLEGRVADALAALQRAEQLHARQGEHRRAARSAFWLGFLLLGRGELAQGSGWLARARRLLEHEPPDCPEHGYLLLPAAMEQLGAGDHAAAQATAARAAGIGHQAGEADLVALALFLQGGATVLGGRVADGLDLLDEAMVGVVA